jgi:hypothetical protein
VEARPERLVAGAVQRRVGTRVDEAESAAELADLEGAEVVGAAAPAKKRPVRDSEPGWPDWANFRPMGDRLT